VRKVTEKKIGRKIVLFLFVMLMVILGAKDFFSNKSDFEKNSQFVIIDEKEIVVEKTPVFIELPRPVATIVPEPEITPVPEPKKLELEKEEPTFEQLAPTTTMSFAELVGDNGDHSNYIPPFPASDTYKLLVNVYYQFITVYKKDEDGKFTIPVRYMICTTGTKGNNATPIGIFEIEGHKVRFNRFWDYNVWAQYWTQLVEDYYFHSLLYKKKDANTYTSSYSKLGTRVSHGCIRLLVPDARWMYYNIGPGSLVEVVDGEENEEQAAIREQLIFPPLPEERPGLIAGEIPVTEAWPGYSGPLTSDLPMDWFRDGND
jgi:L,D-transpeptidase-like protein